MSGILKGVTKNDLLKLKGSKPVPITAHSNEVVVPVVYATRVKQFMKKEGMSVPLSPEQLSTLKSKARDTVGTMDSSYAVGGSIKLKKIRAKKIKINKNVVKKGNVKQIVNIKLGDRVIRRPSTRAKAVGKENIPIRPGVSTYPMSTEPAYSRMIPSTGTITNVPLPTITNVAAVSSLVKPASMPTTVKPTVVDVLKRADVGRQAALAARKKDLPGHPPGTIRSRTGQLYSTTEPEGKLRPVVAPKK